MTGVFIAASQSDRKIWGTFPSILCRHLNAGFAQDRSSWNASDDRTIVIDSLQNAVCLHPENAILIFKEMEKLPCSFPAGEKTVAVVDASGDCDMLQQVSRTMLPGITCGLSARDTMTLSSICADSAVVTLQRSIVCFNGEIIEPQEIPLKLTTNIDRFTLMAAAAVFLLTGNINLLKKLKFN